MLNIIDRSAIFDITGMNYVEIPEKVIFNRLIDVLNEIIIEISVIKADIKELKEIK